MTSNNSLLAQVEKKPLELWFDSPAGFWEEALPLGNGRTGAMVFGGVQREQYSLNDHHLWSGGPVPGNEGSPEILKQVRQTVFDGDYSEADQIWRGMHGPYSARYLPMGDLFLEFPSDHNSIENYKRSLDLRNALSTVTYEQEGVVCKRESFISHPDQVMVVRLSASEAGKISFNASLTSKLNHTVEIEAADYLILKGKAPAYVAHRESEPEQVVYEPEGEGMTFEMHLRVFSQGGEPFSGDNTIGVANADEVLLVLATATSFNGFDKSPAFEGKDPARVAGEIFNSIAEYSWEHLYNRHLADYAELFDRVELDLGPVSGLPTSTRLLKYHEGNDDHDLISLYFQYGRYLLIASSRTGTPPANLQGIWNRHVQPPWGSNYTININTQMNFWPAEITNLSELHHSLFDFMEGLSVNGAETAKVNYGIESGWVAHHNSDVWAKTSPPGGSDWDMGSSPRWSCWPMGGAWFTQHLWEHYLHTGDKDFLANKAWPLMKGSAEFLMNWMVEDSKGQLVTNPATSPENVFRYQDQEMGISMASTMDMSIIRESFSNLLRASAQLGIEDAFIESVRAAVPRLYPFHIGRMGQLQEWYRDWDRSDDTHRHISHLYSLYPGSQISPEYSPELASAGIQTLIHRGDVSTGWSMAWKLNWWARLKDGNRGLDILKGGLKPKTEGSREATFGNLFSTAHGHFQIDGTFGGPAGIAELLMQSHAGYIHLLPALPDAWSSGSISGLLARGGFVVDMIWEGGELQTFTIHSKLGGNCRLLFDDALTSDDAGLEVARGFNPNSLLQQPDLVPWINNAEGELPEINHVTGTLYDFATEAGKTYHFKRK
ncbi:MAG: glycoside hydrolase family 95 protein [Bacteroidota bacterium]